MNERTLKARIARRRRAQGAAMVEAAMMIPILCGFLALLGFAHAEYDAAVASYNATLINALHETADVVTSRRSLDGQLASLQSSVDSVEEAYQMVTKRYRGGLASYLEVLSVEDTLLSARSELADAQSRTLALDVALVRALGGGFKTPAAP